MCTWNHVNFKFFSSLSLVTWQMMNHQLIGLSDTLGVCPPPAGAVNPLPSPSESPHQGRRSVVDSPGHSPSNTK